MIIFVIVFVCVFVICYCLYGIFFVCKVLCVDDSEVIFFYIFEDGKDYVLIKKWVNFGSYFVVIVVVGFLVGFVLVV